MADYYCDHGAYATTLGATPTWAEPQEGDGLASSTSSAAGTCSIDLTSYTSVSGNVSVFGSSTISFAASSGSTLATNIANAINGSSTTLPVGGKIGFAAQVRNFVWARATGATLEIMCRVGSALLNVTGIAFGGTWSGSTPPALTFSGGVSGCWGNLYNDSIIGVSSSIAKYSYGVLTQSPYVWDSAITDYDTIHVRTGRNVTISHFNGVNGISNNPTNHSYTNLLFDDGTVWAGDSPSDTLTIAWSGYGAGVFSQGPGKYLSIKCRSHAGLTITIAYTSAYQNFLFQSGASTGPLGIHLEHVKFLELYQSSTTLGWGVKATTYGYWSISIVNCEFDFTAIQRQNLGIPFLLIGYQGFYQHRARIIGNTITWNLNGVGGVDAQVALCQIQAATTAPVTVEFSGNTIVTGATSQLKTFEIVGGTTCAGFTLIGENNNGAEMPSGAAGITPAAHSDVNSATMYVNNIDIGGPAKFENRAGYVEFNNGQPTLSTQSLGGMSWSWKVYWTNGVNYIRPGSPFVLPMSRQRCSLTTGVRTWRIDLLLDSVCAAQIEQHGVVDVFYVNSTGEAVCESIPITITAVSNGWSDIGSAPYDSWASYKVEGVTSQSVLSGTSINIRMVLTRSLSGASTGSFIFNPEATIS